MHRPVAAMSACISSLSVQDYLCMVRDDARLMREKAVEMCMCSNNIHYRNIVVVTSVRISS